MISCCCFSWQHEVAVQINHQHPCPFRNADSILFTFIKLLYIQVFDVAKFSISTLLQRGMSKCKVGYTTH